MIKNAKGQVEFENLAGREFGHVIVLDHWNKQPNGGVKWLVECRCENKSQWLVWAEVLKRSPNICCRHCRNAVISANQRARTGSFANVDKWPGGSPEAKALRAKCGSIQRCYNAKGPSYSRYGGRGIRVCDGLRNSEVFLSVVGLPPFPTWSYGRLNNDGNYSCGQCAECIEKGWPLNVAWQDQFTQNNNRSSNRYIMIGGKLQTITQVAVKYGISPYALSSRIKKGMSQEKLLFQNNVDRNGVLFYSLNC